MSGVPINIVARLLTLEEFCGVDQPVHAELPPGTARFDYEFEMLEFTCPCGCGHVHCVAYNIGQKEPESWLFNGDYAKPTLTPSIQCTSACKWHGYLTDGVWLAC